MRSHDEQKTIDQLISFSLKAMVRGSCVDALLCWLKSRGRRQFKVGGRGWSAGAR